MEPRRMRTTIGKRRLILGGIAVLALMAITRLSEISQAGMSAPGFVAETVDHEKLALADYQGKSAILLNFYANY
jgi:hypothetical protein